MVMLSSSAEVLLYNMLIHSLPFVIFVLSWLLSDVILLKRHFKRTTVPVIGYLICNYAYVRTTGVALYPFYDWNNDFYAALIASVFTVIFFTLVYIVEAEITQRVKADFI